MAQINIRIDDALKEQAGRLFEELGMNMSTAVNMFIRQTLRQRRIPFTIAADPEGSLHGADTAAEAEPGCGEGPADPL